MARINSLAILLVFALFGCHLSQNAPSAETPKPDNITTTTSTTTTTTTTLAPKTTTTTTTTTTPAPTTTSTTPGPTPTPAPVPKILEGNITDASNHTCIRYEFTVRFVVKYNTTANTTEKATLALPLDSKLSFNSEICNSSKESFLLSAKDNSIIFNLTFGNNENSVFLDSLILTVVFDNKSFPNIETDLLGKNRTVTLANLNSFNVEKTHSYLCTNVTVPKNDDAEVRVVFENLKLQAFMDKNQNGQFSSEHNCQNEINDIVPIAVGAALTGLVVIVMVAYFIGRRRSRRLAYQSV